MNEAAAAPGIKLGTAALVLAIACAAAFAVGRFSAPSPELVAPAPQLAPQAPIAAPMADPMLPPGHPPIDAQAQGAPAIDPATGMQMAAHNDGALKWAKPAAWQDLPNSSSLRIATYGVPKATGDSEAPQLTVMQAGGSLEANIDRWAGQFGEQGRKALARESKQIAGFAVTVVQTHGSYDGGMAPGAQPSGGESALLAAIVETGEMPYFFKMTGPRKSVEAARGDFDALLASLQRAQ